jgi:hypothetical protein
MVNSMMFKNGGLERWGKSFCYTSQSFHFIFTVHLFIIELFVPTNALRHFFTVFFIMSLPPILYDVVTYTDSLL